MHPLRRRLRRVRRTVLLHRRGLAALCVAVAVAASLQATTAPPPRRELVLTATHDLAGGVVLEPRDLRRVPFDPASVPSHVVGDPSRAVGRTTAGPVRAGEPLTDARLVTGSLLQGHPGTVAVPVRIGDPGAVRLLRVGDRVDLLAADPQGDEEATLLARDVLVLAVPHAGEESPELTNGALVVLALPAAGARQVAQASVSAFLSVVLTR